ncbi:hypothetical protein LTR84_012668 [Exophiala bonariae]|uniref:HIT domain-containing protein n=1 Tax=Exophiala bonariae TaxID=1690606 RepID=A0AAV9NF41_9EURO|nr:hypothetical protein LTR84_012668 [Exophiala bonariae]
MESVLGLREPLSTLTSRKFREAYKRKDLVFSETLLATIRSQKGVPFQLRYCPALAKKPATTTTKTQKDSTEKEKQPKKPKFNPFANPASELLIAEILNKGEASHNLVLNKYPVIHNHFIISTKANKPQTAVLEEDDLIMTYACLRAWTEQQETATQTPRGRLFSFFNSGEHSGASQAHRHLQFLPVEDMASSDDEKNGFELLIDRMTASAHPTLPLYQDKSLPILHFATPLQPSLSAAELHSRYMLLLRAALASSRHPGRAFSNDDKAINIESNGSTVFSYNLAMTTERMAICPRRQEGTSIPGAGPDSFVAINGTILGGTLMVKDEGEWDVLTQRQEDDSSAILDGLLSSLGYPLVSWPASEEVSAAL